MSDTEQSEKTENNNEKRKRRFALPLMRFKFGVDSIILAIASSMLVLSLVFLFADGYLFGGGDYANLMAVGKFSTSKNDVRRRVDAGLSWSTVYSKDIVYEGDSIFTGDSSEAAIQLDNGTVLKVDPKSLVVIRTKGNKLEIDLQYGSLQGKIGSGDDQAIVLTQNGQSQELSGQNSELRIVKDEKSVNTRVQIVSGEVKFKDKNSVKVVKKDEELSVDDKGPAKITRADVVLVSPSSGDIQWLSIGKSTPFKWKPAKKSFNGVFEIAKDPSFAVKIRETPVTGTSINVGDTQEIRGPLYWRVRSIEAGANNPVAWKVSLFDDVPPLPVLPSADQILMIPKNSKSGEVSTFLTWEDTSGSQDFEYEISRIPDMRKPFEAGKTTEFGARVKLLEGDYYWRVKGLHAERKNSPWSRVMHFAVRRGDRELEAPQLLVKKLEFKIPRSVLPPAGEVVDHVQVSDAPAFEWTPVKEAVSYVAEFSEDENFNRADSVDITDGTKFAPTTVRPGSAYFRVRAKNKSGKPGKPSDIGRLEIELPAPKLAGIPDKKLSSFKKKELDKAVHEFKVQWEGLPFASKYELVWGADSEFKRSKAISLQGTEKKIKVMKPMNYAAKVRALNAKGEPISPYSNVQIAGFEKELKIAKPIPKPIELPKIVEQPKPAGSREPAAAFGLAGVRILEPKANTSLVSLEHAPTFVRFTWRSYAKAQHYVIQIAEDADFTKVVKKTTVKQTAFVFEDALPEGKVFWRVRAKTKGGYSEWSEVTALNVLYR
ncbi:MAG TPA: hypothetical protein VM432_01345 [Bdellovibrionales bacterium]|nr:hypothetical protein [Bdellovibrionales bacterium]